MTTTAKLKHVEEHCEDCRYFQPYEGDDIPDPDPDDDDDDLIASATTGVCRRSPPVILMAYPEPITRHPDVAGDHDWCGEFTPAHP